jgi:hypothetical protein
MGMATCETGGQAPHIFMILSAILPCGERQALLLCRCVIEHLVFPTQKLPPETEAADNGLARSLLATTSPETPAALSSNPVMKLTQSLLTRLIGPSKFRVGAARNNRLLLVRKHCVTPWQAP